MYTRLQRRLWYVMAFLFATNIVTMISTMVYAAHVDKESNHKWCEVINTMNEGYKQGEPTTPIGIKLKKDMARLHDDFHC